MRIGLSLRPVQGGRDEIKRELLADARAAENAGFSSIWVAQTPTGFDALTALTLVGQVTQRVELGTAVLPIQSRHPIALAQHALSVQTACDSRLTLGIGVSHHWIVADMLGLPYEKPAAQMRAYLEVLQQSFKSRGPVTVANEVYRVNIALDVTDEVATPILVAALAPLMLRIAGEGTAGTILWMADERAVAEHVVPRIVEAAEQAGRPAPRIVAGIPITLCRRDEVEAAQSAAKQRYGYVETAPNYARLLERGDAQGIRDVLVAGDESAVTRRLAQFRDAGVTDLNAIVMPLGSDDEERRASRTRTEGLLASLAPEM